MNALVEEVGRVLVTALYKTGAYENLMEAKTVAETLRSPSERDKRYWADLQLGLILMEIGRHRNDLRAFDEAAQHFRRSLAGRFDTIELRASCMAQFARASFYAHKDSTTRLEEALEFIRSTLAVFRPDSHPDEFADCAELRDRVLGVLKTLRRPLTLADRKLFKSISVCDEHSALAAIHRGADVEARDSDGCTPVHLAIGEACTPVLKLLLSRGASLVAVDDSGFSALHWAAMVEDPAFAAIAENVSIDSRDDRGLTPLMWAAMRSVAVVESLLMRSASLELSDDDGWTALHHAVSANKVSVVECLVRRGANKQALSFQGESPGDLANRLGHSKLINLLTTC